MRTIQERVEADGFGCAEPVLFYGTRGKNAYGSNFSRHDIWLNSPWTGERTWYRTGEHRYQAMKSLTKEGHDHVVSVATPGMSKREGRKVLLRIDWGSRYGDTCYRYMLELVTSKAHQHPTVLCWLSETGNLPIYEDSPTDAIWGVRNGDSYTGRNLLGRAWMEARNTLCMPRKPPFGD